MRARPATQPADRSAKFPQAAPRLLIVVRHFPTAVGVDCYSTDRISLRTAELLKVPPDPRHEIAAEELTRLRLGPSWAELWSDMHHVGGLTITGATPEQEAARLNGLAMLDAIQDAAALLRGEKARARR